jgi:hypothetical protein
MDMSSFGIVASCSFGNLTTLTDYGVTTVLDDSNLNYCLKNTSSVCYEYLNDDYF